MHGSRRLQEVLYRDDPNGWVADIPATSNPLDSTEIVHAWRPRGRFPPGRRALFPSMVERHRAASLSAHPPSTGHHTRGIPRPSAMSGFWLMSADGCANVSRPPPTPKPLPADHTSQRTARARIKLLFHPARFERQPARFHSQFHRERHLLRVFSRGNGGIHQNSVGA